MLVLLGSSADRLMRCIGSEWVLASDAVIVLSCYGLMLLPSQYYGPLLQAIGRPYLLATITWSLVGFGAVSMVIVGMVLQNSPVHHQVTGIAFVRIATGMCLLTVLFSILWRVCRISIWDLLTKMRASLLSGLAILVVSLLTRAFVPLNGEAFRVNLIVQVSLSGVAGLAVLLLCEPSLMANAVNRIRGAVWPTRCAEVK